MFEFLFKRPGDKNTGAPAGQAAPVQDGSAPAGTAPATATSAAREQQAHQVAKARRRSLAPPTSFFSAISPSCAWPPLNSFIPAPSSNACTRAFCNTDRRVAKLMHSRLDAIRHHDAEVQRGQAAVTQAEALLADDKLTPNLVADLDRAWAVIKAPELTGQFDTLRAAGAAPGSPNGPAARHDRPAG
ncbi:hypothetical protein LP420_34710 [Massilia sp. B-10]|nr:hypothetical protein LP420_34710 [Massilia sp. B-10]